MTSLPVEPLVPRPEDVVQGTISACPLAGVMVAMAHTRPAPVAAILGARIPEEAFGRRAGQALFSIWTAEHYVVRFRRGAPIKISPAVYFQGPEVRYARTATGAGWPGLIEKAYAVWRGHGSYNGLDKHKSLSPSPHAAMVLHDLAGNPPSMIDFPGNRYHHAQGGSAVLSANHLTTMLGNARLYPTIAASIQGNAPHPVVPDHTYAVLGMSNQNQRVRLRNPWNGQGALLSLGLDQFRQKFEAVWQAR